MIKRITAISFAALVLTAAVPLSASAQTDAQTWWGPGSWHAGYSPDSGYMRGSSNGYGYWLNAPNYPYAPQGGNSGGANFPHPGT